MQLLGYVRSNMDRTSAGLLTDIDQLNQPVIAWELVHRLAFAEPAFINAQALSAAIAPMSDRPTLDQAMAGAWLVKNASVMSARQVLPSEVNGPVRVSGEQVRAARPPRYGRALVVPAEASAFTADVGNVLLDVKGCGVAPDRTPSAADHCNGMLSLPQAFEEYTKQRVLEVVFQRAGVAVQGIPVFGILHLGFPVRMPDGTFHPAALMIRQSHVRPQNGIELAKQGTEDQRAQLQVELILRQHGLTSCSTATQLQLVRNGGEVKCIYGGIERHDVPQRWLHELLGPEQQRLTFDCTNIQHARGPVVAPLQASLVDFSHYEARPRFEFPLLSLVVDRPLNWGGALWPHDSRWIQPNAACVDLPLLGPREVPGPLRDWYGLGGSQTLPGASLLGLQLSHDFSRGLLTPSDVSTAIETFAAEATSAIG
jgi:hypothetical protein